MTPFEIKLLLHIYTSVSRPDDCSILEPTLRQFQSHGLIEPYEPSAPEYFRWHATDKGKAFCAALQEVPLPTSQWVVEMPTVRYP